SWPAPRLMMREALADETGDELDERHEPRVIHPHGADERHAAAERRRVARDDEAAGAEPVEARRRRLRPEHDLGARRGVLLGDLVDDLDEHRALLERLEQGAHAADV